MQAEIDVLQLLKGFASRNQLTSVEYRQFVPYVQRHARSGDQTQPLYRDLSIHPDSVLIPKLYQLARDRKISLLTTGNQVDGILLPEAYTEAVMAEYRRMEENPDIPFPDEDNLKLSIPPEWVQVVSVDTDLVALLDYEGERPVPLYRIVFPESLKSVIIMSSAIDEKLLEYTVLKIRYYLRKGNNKDYIHQRLLGAFGGKESILKDYLASILLKPFDSIAELRNGKSDFTYPFWAYLASTIRKDLSGKVERIPEDIATYQAAFFIDVFNTYYKGRTQRVVERENAFKALGAAMRKVPFVFSVEDITAFRDGQGRPLLGKYTREELEEWLRERTTTATEGGLPELLVVVSRQGRRVLVAKDKLLPLTVKLLHEARSVVKLRITEDWRKILFAYATVESMNDDLLFRKDLAERLEQASPLLGAIIEAKFPPLVFSEERISKEGLSGLDRYFGDGKTAPTEVILDLDRKRLLTDVRMLLPIWYTIPVLSWFISVWKRMVKRREDRKKRVVRAIRTGAEAEQVSARTGNDRASEFAAAAAQVERRLVPEGFTLDEYLSDLVGKWNVSLDLKVKANLTEDINSLVRDYLRNVLRTMKPSSFTVDRLETLSSNLADTPTLLKIRNHSALEEYIKLYMVKMLKR